jgi:hypothetical protein
VAKAGCSTDASPPSQSTFAAPGKISIEQSELSNLQSPGLKRNRKILPDTYWITEHPASDQNSAKAQTQLTQSINQIARSLAD